MGGYIENRTPITVLYNDDPGDHLDCIPVMITGEDLIAIVDEDNNRDGYKRGDETYIDVETIGDILVRERDKVAQSA